MYSYKIEQAIKAASLLHQDQLRKGDQSIPYISHLLSVVLILRDYTTDENTLAAAILHDTVEDTGYTMEELEEDFGKKIAEIVSAVTEPRAKNEEKIAWIENKKNYAKQLKTGPIEAVHVAAADKIHNFRSIVDEYYEDHNSFLRDFGTELDLRLEAYHSISNAINSRLTDGIVHEFNHTFKAYKDFISDVKKSIS